MQKEKSTVIISLNLSGCLGFLIALLDFPELIRLYQLGKKFRHIDDNKADSTSLTPAEQRAHSDFILSKNRS
jgi:hypothetical protein